MILIIGHIISLSTGLSLYGLFGDPGCFVFWGAVNVLVTTTFVSGFCMSLFRWICIIHIDEALIMGMQRVKMLIHVVEGTLYVLALLFQSMVYAYGSKPLAMSFCHDKSKTFLEIKAKHDHDTNAGEHALKIYVGFLQSLGLLEFLMYVYLFKTLWFHDQKMASSVSEKIIKKRNKTNVITLSGQAWGFAIETITSIATNLLIALNFDSAFLQPQIAPFYYVMTSTALSVGQFVTSPDMRSFYWDSDGQ